MSFLIQKWILLCHHACTQPHYAAGHNGITFNVLTSYFAETCFTHLSFVLPISFRVYILVLITYVLVIVIFRRHSILHVLILIIYCCLHYPPKFTKAHFMITLFSIYGLRSYVHSFSLCMDFFMIYHISNLNQIKIRFSSLSTETHFQFSV